MPDMSTTHHHNLADQLVLDFPLAESSRPLQFRLDTRTRRRGLAHISQIRRQAALRQAGRSTAHAA